MKPNLKRRAMKRRIHAAYIERVIETRETENPIYSNRSSIEKIEAIKARDAKAKPRHKKRKSTTPRPWFTYRWARREQEKEARRRFS